MNTQTRTPDHIDPAPGAQPGGPMHRRRSLFILVFDLKSLGFLDANESAIQQYGYSHAQFLAMTLKDLMPGAKVSRLAHFVRRMPEQRVSTIVCEHLTQAGGSLVVEMQCYRFVFRERPAAIALTREITDTVQIQNLRGQGWRAEKTVRGYPPDIVSRVDRRLMVIELNRELDRLAAQASATPAGPATGEAVGLWSAEPAWPTAQRAALHAGTPGLQRGHWLPGWQGMFDFLRARHGVHALAPLKRERHGDQGLD